MSNWDLMMPGMGLTSIGLAGVVLAYADIAHTFIDGMHALAGLTMFIGLVILAVGILDGGVSTSNRAKATTLVILSISLSFGAYAFLYNTVSTTAMFAGVLMAIAAPSTIIAYISVKHPHIVKPVAMIFILGSVAGISAFVGFGLVGPDPYLLSEAVEPEPEPEPVTATSPDAPEYEILMLAGSAVAGAPDYEPDEAVVPRGHIVVWVNEDDLMHTATSKDDMGATFDSVFVNPGEEFRLDTSDLEAGTYEYFCLVHPFMVSTLTIAEPEAVGETITVSIPENSSIIEHGKAYYEPADLTIPAGTTVSWSNDDVAAHAVASLEGDSFGGLFDSGIMPQGAVFEYTFEEAGTVDYFCNLHPWMVGTVTVE